VIYQLKHNYKYTVNCLAFTVFLTLCLISEIFTIVLSVSLNMDQRNRSGGGRHQDFYDHSTAYGRFSAFVNRLPWNWILITCALGFLVFIVYISIGPPIEETDAMIFYLDSAEFGNETLVNDGTLYVYQGDGVHPIKFPGFDTSLNLSSVQTIQFQNVNIDLPELISQMSENGLDKLVSISMNNVTVSGTLLDQKVPRVQINFIM